MISLAAFSDELTKIAESMTPAQQRMFAAGMRRIADNAIAGGGIVGDQPSFDEVAAAKGRLQETATPQSTEMEHPHPALVVGGGLLGLGTGYAGGHLAMEGLDRLLKRQEGMGVPSSVLRYAPAAAGLTGLAVGAHQAYVWDKARKAMKERRKKDGSENS